MMTRPLPSNKKFNYTLNKELSTQVQSEFQFDAVLSASALAQQAHPYSATEMDLSEAANQKSNYDKILLLINHGEAAIKKNIPFGPLLTGRGVGQALTLSHQTAAAELAPELVVIAPLECSIQTTLHAFPYSSPDMVRGCSWICHGSLVNENEHPASISTLEQNFPGLDYSLYEKGDNQEEFMDWLRARPERVIVVSSTTEWLQSLCGNTLEYESKTGGVTKAFQEGEMRAIGLNFS